MDGKTVKEETKATLKKYGICVGIELLIAFLVIWSKGFFAHSAAVNLQILADAFFVSGLLMTLFACLMYVSDEGIFIALGYVMKDALSFIFPRGKHERYYDYRERKMSKAKKYEKKHIFVTGLTFLIIGIVLTAIWAAIFYNV